METHTTENTMTTQTTTIAERAALADGDDGAWVETIRETCRQFGARWPQETDHGTRYGFEDGSAIVVIEQICWDVEARAAVEEWSCASCGSDCAGECDGFRNGSIRYA